ncbi:MAG: hypothetical protein K6U87_12235 [Firmicutes bacterium]|nr:hypothetical protein [Bacillota bacterium]
MFTFRAPKWISQSQAPARRGWAAVALAVGSSVLVSCGSAASPQPSPSAQSATNSTQAAAAFFRGKTITLIAPDAPGGGYDTWDRLVAPYLAKALGAQVRVVNVPQAGTIVGTNEMAASKPDGLTLGDVAVGGDIGNLIEHQPGQQFDLTKLTWLAGPTLEPVAIFATPASHFQHFSDLLALKAGGPSVPVIDTRSGAGDLTNRVIFNLFGIPHRLLTGYGSSKELEAGFLRGDGSIASVTYSSWRSLVEARKAIPLLVTTLQTQWPAAPEATTIGQLLQSHNLTAQQKTALTTLANITSLAFDFAGPPNIPPDRVAVLRQAFQTALTNPALLSQARKEGLTVDYISGSKLAQLIRQTIDNSQSLTPYLK